jgi:glyoxylate/hydroxypyruvate reductase A
MSRLTGVYLSTELDLKAIYGETFARLAPEIDLRAPDEIDDPASVRYAVCWLPAPDAFEPYPNLAFVSSIAAGVDAILRAPSLPDVPVLRVRDPEQGQVMAGYVVSAVLWWERRFPEHLANQAAGHWDRFSIRQPSGVTVGFIGYGLMGQASALTLKTLGFDVVAAIRSTPKAEIDGVRYETGDDAMARVAAQSDYLVNLLPLTDATRGLFSAAFFAGMRPGAVFINAGRGGQTDEAALLAALDSGHLIGAAIDVFAQEPLPVDSAFWRHPRVLLTPHDAAEASPQALVKTIATAVRCLAEGLPIPDPVSRVRGY